MKSISTFLFIVWLGILGAVIVTENRALVRVLPIVGVITFLYLVYASIVIAIKNKEKKSVNNNTQEKKETSESQTQDEN